jgi:threonine dehydrogenase-like Zn-dependent dehydrogenase
VKAAVLYEVKKPLVIEEVSIDKPRPREVLIRTKAAGVCHSDLHFIEGRSRFRCRRPGSSGGRGRSGRPEVGRQARRRHHLPLRVLRFATTARPGLSSAPIPA